MSEIGYDRTEAGNRNSNDVENTAQQAASGNRASGHVALTLGTGFFTNIATEEYNFVALRTDPVTPFAAKGEYHMKLVTTTGVLVEFVEGFKSTTVFKMLTDFVIFAASLFYMLGVLAVIVLRRKLPQLDRPYRTLGYPIVPVAFLAVYCWFLPQVYRAMPFVSNAGLVLISLGVPVYFGWQSWTARQACVAPRSE